MTDINDIFDSIVFTEERLSEQGFEEGFTTGATAGSSEGYHLGYHRGAELGAELGYYHAIITHHLQLQQSDANLKLKKLLTELKDKIESFPDTNREDFDVIAEADQVRAKYKRVCALLKIDSKFPYTDELNF